MADIVSPAAEFRGSSLQGREIDRLTRTLADLTDIFRDKDALTAMPGDLKVYDVAS